MCVYVCVCIYMYTYMYIYIYMIHYHQAKNIQKNCTKKVLMADDVVTPLEPDILEWNIKDLLLRRKVMTNLDSA